MEDFQSAEDTGNLHFHKVQLLGTMCQAQLETNLFAWPGCQAFTGLCWDTHTAGVVGIPEKL